MSIFKDFTEDCHPEYDQLVVIYDMINNTYECVSEFKFDDNLFAEAEQICECAGESKSCSNVYYHYPRFIKWYSMEDIVDKFFARIGVKKIKGIINGY